MRAATYPEPGPASRVKAGDTAYAGVAPIGRHRFLVTWYSSRLSADEPWRVGALGPTDIWQATLDLSQL